MPELTMQLKQTIEDMKVVIAEKTITFENAHLVAESLIKRDKKAAQALMLELKAQL